MFDKIGKYDEDYQIAADYKFTLQAIFQHDCNQQYIPEIFSIFDRSGVGFLNPEKREDEKHKAQIEIFGPQAIEKCTKADSPSTLFQFISNIMSKFFRKSSKTPKISSLKSTFAQSSPILAIFLIT